MTYGLPTLPMLPGSRANQSIIPELDPQEESALLAQIGGGLLSGVGWLGEALGKGGAAVRGVLSGIQGGPWGGGLLNLIPFSDTLGITRPEEKVTGEALNQQLGIDTGSDVGNFIAGMGTDILTDPLSWFGGLAGSGLSRAGKVAQKAGLWEKGTKLPGLGRVASKQQGSIKKLLNALPDAERAAKEADLAKVFGKMGSSADEIAKLSEAPLGGLLNFGFFGAPWQTIGTTSPLAQKIGQGIDTAIRGLKGTFVGQLGRALFDPRVQGTMGATRQSVAEAASVGAPKAVMEATQNIGKVQEEFAPILAAFREAFDPAITKQFGIAADAPEALARQASKTWDEIGRMTAETGDAQKAMEFFLPGAQKGLAKAPEIRQSMEAALERLHADHKAMYELSEQMGLGAPWMNEEAVRHFFRTGTRSASEAERQVRKMLQTTAGHIKPREEVLASVPAGVVNRIATDPAARGKDAAEHIFKQYGEFLGGKGSAFDGKPADHAIALAAYMKGTKHEAVYGKQFLEDQFRYQKSELLRQSSANAIHMTYADHLGTDTPTLGAALASARFGNMDVPLDAQKALAALGTLTQRIPQELANLDVPLDKTLRVSDIAKAIGAKPKQVKEALARAAGITVKDADAFRASTGVVSLEKAYSAVGMKSDKAVEWLSKLTGKSADELKSMTVPSEWVAAARGIIKPMQNSEWGGALGRWVDKLTGVLKSHFTMPWPAFHMRNFQWAHTANMTNGTIEGIGDFVKYGKWAMKTLPWKTPPEDLLRDARAVGLIGSHGFEDMPLELAQRGGRWGLGTHLAEDLASANPLSMGETLSAAKESVAGTPSVVPGLDLLPGYKGLRTAAEFVTKTGGKVHTRIESSVRLAEFGYLTREKGWSLEAAAEMVNKTHFNYSPESATPFERTVGKRIIPFYCVPETSLALTRDGWMPYWEIAVGDELLTYNVEKDEYEWQPCLEIAAFDCDQPILEWANKRHRLQFTHNHRWPVRRNAAVVALANGTTRHHPFKRLVVEGTGLKSIHQFVMAAKFPPSQPSLLAPEDARLLGWLITDGYWRWRGNYLEAMIYQHPKKFLDEVKAVAGGKPRKPHPDTGVVCVPVLQERLVNIRTYLASREFTRVVTRLSREAMEAMYDAMYKANGVTKPTCRQDAFAAMKPEVKEAFRVLGTLLGKRVSDVSEGCYVSHCRHMRVATGKLREVHYKGTVWCPRTANGTWVMMQRRTIVITGNTFTKNMIPLLADTLMQRPGGALATMIKETGRVKEPGEIVPPHIGQTLAWHVGTDKTGGDRYLTTGGMGYEDPAGFLGGGLRGAGMELVSRMNPLIKAPLEYISGQSMFQRGPSGGRKLEDLDPALGRTIANITGEPKLLNLGPLGETILGNSPVSRALTTARTLTDPRKEAWAKALNIFTPFKVSDVTEGATDAMVREAITDLMRDIPGAKEFTRVHVPESLRAQLTPEQLKQYKQYQALQKVLEKKSKERKKSRELEFMLP